MLLGALALICMLQGCGEETGSVSVVEETEAIIIDDGAFISPEITVALKEEPEITQMQEEPEKPLIMSELTGLYIDEALDNKRPLAVIVPNNSSALPQYEISEAGVIYECLAEGKISRLLCVFDDWRDMERIGNVRSARSYFVYWALEWDSILFHCGNVLYADPILASEACDNINCVKCNYGWYRITDENRIYEQTLYTDTGGIIEACRQLDYSLEHTEYHTPSHWKFSEDIVDLSEKEESYELVNLDLSKEFPENKPYYEYDESSGEYLRFQYGKPQIDAAHDDRQLSFKNILIQYTGVSVLDEYDHLEYSICGGGEGLYITEGRAVPVTWRKEGDLLPTRFYYSDGREVELSGGKTIVEVVGISDNN